MGEAEFVDESLDAVRFLERIEVFALDVLDERERERRLIGNVAHERRDLVEPCTSRREPPALSRDDLEAAAVDRPDEYRLHDALALDGCGELVERCLVHARSRLVAPGADLVE